LLRFDRPTIHEQELCHDDDPFTTEPLEQMRPT
jgi:hypothetical protein